MTINGIFRLGRAAGVAAALMASTEAHAQWGRKNCPPQPCETPIYIAPGAPMAPSAQPGAAPTTPQSPSAQAPQASPNLSDQIANAAGSSNMPSSFAAAAAPQNLAPNMIGDFFSASTNAIKIPKLRGGFYDGATGVASWPDSNVIAPLTPGQPIQFTGSLATATLGIQLADGTAVPGFPVPLALLGVTTNLDAQSLNPFTPGGTGATIPMSTNSAIVSQAYAAARQFVIAGETALLAPGETLVQADVVVNNGVATRSTTGGPDPVVGDLYAISYSGSAMSIIASNETVLVNVNSPSGGGLFGRLKLSENNSPMPRDRFFFDYSYFSDVPIASQGAHVQVFRPGFEKTFLNGQASFEFRMPFAATVDSTQNADGNLAYNSEFGNLTFAGKALLYSNGTWAFTAGAGVIMPTADDVQVNLFGIPIVRVNNEAYHIQPYLAALYSPNDRFFVQSFIQLDFGLNGNSVYADPTVAGNLGKIGHLNDQHSIFFDVGMGYWIVRNDDGESFIRGLAPVLEFHYNQSLNDGDIVALGALGVGGLAGDYSIVNTTMGLNVDLRSNTSMMLGVAMPLTSDRQFNYELSLQLNQRFGSGGRAPQTSPDF